MNRTLLMLLIALITACSAKEKTDLIFHNARIYTVDSTFSLAEALAVKDGMILASGRNAEILKRYDADTIIDAGGRAVYPGFNDGHCHFYGYGYSLSQYADLRGTASFDDVLQILRNYHETHPYIWLLGRGWDQNDWESKEFPDNSKLDQLFPENPVILIRIDGHAALVNSEALRRAGITADMNIEGGQVMVKNGKMTGILLDNAVDKVRSILPESGPGIIRDALLRSQEDCFAQGLTSVTDAGLEYSVIRTIDSLQQAGGLKIRINAMISPSLDNISGFLEKGPHHTDRLNVSSIKLYADGALGSRGALLLEPYSDDPGSQGLQMSGPGYFREIIQMAYMNDFQVNTHCIGDSAVRLMLGLYGEALGGKNDRRWRIEHAQVIHPDDFNLFGRYSVIPSIQSTHCTSDMYWAGERLGPDRIKGAYAWQRLLSQNGWLVNGTDFPIEQVSPLLTFYAAITRKDTKGFPEGGFQSEEALSREEALRSITIWPAMGSFEENKKGSLEPGKWADIVVLDEDIMAVDPGEIPGIKVWRTFSGGEMVYVKPEP